MSLLVLDVNTAGFFHATHQHLGATHRPRTEIECASAGCCRCCFRRCGRRSCPRDATERRFSTLVRHSLRLSTHRRRNSRLRHGDKTIRGVRLRQQQVDVRQGEHEASTKLRKITDLRKSENTQTKSLALAFAE